MFRTRSQFAVVILILSAVAAGLVVYRSSISVAADPHTALQAEGPSVDVTQVQARNITAWYEYSGRLEAVDRVDIRSQVSGTLTAVHFSDGSIVNKGDVLFTIDPRPYQAAVDRAQAQLAAAKARAAYTATESARGKRLLAARAIAKRDYEEKSNAARVASAQVLEAKAALEASLLDLEHTRIVAPIAGRMSRAEVTVGNVVVAGAASEPLTSLVSVSKIYASFEIDEQTLLNVVNPARNASDALMPVMLGLGNEDAYPRRGQLVSIDNHLDPLSGTIRARAVFDNPDGALMPGLYARIRIGENRPQAAILVDEKAVGTDQSKRFVIVVDDKNNTSYREVTLGASQDGQRVIEAGLEAGERIVVSGLQRIRPGDVVTPHEAINAPGDATTSQLAAALQ